MNEDELFLFQEELEQAQKEEENKQKIKSQNDNDFGFDEVLKERQKKKDALKERLRNQNLTNREIAKLFSIIEKAEIEMEVIKRDYDYNLKVPGQAVKMRQNLIDVQLKMKKDFDEEFMKILKKKQG